MSQSQLTTLFQYCQSLIWKNIPENTTDSSCSTDSEPNQDKRRPKFRKLKVLNVNCRSLKSKRKQHDLQALLEQEDPDIVCGAESHTGAEHFTSEIFRNSHDIFRKDRNKNGGGVFVGVRKDLLAVQEDGLDTECEALWIKILFAGKQPLYIGSFYRPTNTDPVPLQKLDEVLKTLTGKATLPNIILTGDFNMPDINWENNTIKANPQYGKFINQTLLDMGNDNMLSQLQHLPTRGDNILDLVYTTLPDQVQSIETVPGISDHDAVTVHLDTTVKYGRKKPRTAYVYKKGDVNGLRNEMESFKDQFLQSQPMERSVEANWTMFKEKTFETMDKFIPQKKLSSYQDVPWMSTSTKRLIRKKKRVWKKAKKHNDEQTWQEFRDIRKKVKQQMKKGYEDYVGGILENTMTESHKKFSQFINSQKDSGCIPTLKTESGPATTSKDKAEALNSQY